MKEYFIVDQSGTGEIVEKKSRFIAHVFPVEAEDEALEKIEKIKKEYWDARHNCFAFVIGKNNEIQRFSDDGEPQGTAGKPILEVLTGRNLHNTLIIVTRYFGGTLLGTGGLIRAYGQSAKEGINNAKVMSVCDGISFTVETDYNSIGKIKYIMSQMNINSKEKYGSGVIFYINMREKDFNNFKNQLIEVTSGNVKFSGSTSIEYKENIEK